MHFIFSIDCQYCIIFYSSLYIQYNNIYPIKYAYVAVIISYRRVWSIKLHINYNYQSKLILVALSEGIRPYSQNYIWWRKNLSILLNLFTNTALLIMYISPHPCNIIWFFHSLFIQYFILLLFHFDISDKTIYLYLTIYYNYIIFVFLAVQS